MNFLLIFIQLRYGGNLNQIFSNDEKIDKNNPKFINAKLTSKVYSNLDRSIK